MPTIKTAVDVATSAEIVWRVLTDFPSYPKWNPFLVSVQGNPSPGARLKIQARFPNGGAFKFSARFTEKAYLDYSMYVILDRALPHIGDGLKPVQRRIVYAMSELGLSARGQVQEIRAHRRRRARQVPSARRLGLLRGHGADGAAVQLPLSAGRRPGQLGLAGRSQVLRRDALHRVAAHAPMPSCCSELGQGTVDWVPNFDGTLEEPKLLPARLPNVLLNGTTGIAVGMATDIPPHNLREVAAACVRLLEEPKDARWKELCEHIKGPDFPTEAEIITPRAEIRADVRDRQRLGAPARALGAGGRRHRHHRAAVPGVRLQGAGADRAADAAKKLPMVEDLRDESDHENPTRLVIVPRSNRVDVEELMSHLFATTDLERSYRVNLNMIGINGRPQVKNLRSCSPSGWSSAPRPCAGAWNTARR
jgi:topoisomerase IV subunit A